jgi:uncharacterized protein YndB with AHSA1/START domain
VFEFFTSSELVAAWLVRPYSPSGRAEIDAKVGGKYELFWDPENPQKDSTIGCRITALESGKFLSFEWKGPSQYSHFMNNADPLTHVTVFFIPTDPATTEVHLIHTGWRSSPEWQEAQKYFETAWSSAFEKLRKMVNGS